jgi:hypothetical protein
LESPALMNFSFSINLDTSLPQIEQYGIGHGNIVGNFSDPSRLAFHNFISVTSIELQAWSMGKILYYITSHPNESTKNLNRCISVCLTKVSRSSFKQSMT